MIKLTITIIFHNEEKYLNLILSDILQQQVNLKEIEIIFINNLSSDNSINIVRKFIKANQQLFAKLLLIDSQENNIPAAINLALKHSQALYFIKIDAHARLDVNFLHQAFNLFGKYLAFCGQRPSISLKTDNFSKILLSLEQSKFGSGAAKYRSSQQISEVKSGFHVFYHRDVFTKVGIFNPKYQRTEDNEFNYRLNKTGIKLHYFPQIISYQYIRPDLKSLLRQKYLNGYWVILTAFDNFKIISLFHLVPLIFSLSLIFSICLSYISPLFLLSVSLPYLLADLYFTYQAFREEFNLNKLLLFFLFPLMHLAYGFGGIVAIIHKIFKGG